MLTARKAVIQCPGHDFKLPTLLNKETSHEKRSASKGFKDKIKPSDGDKKACEFAMEFENSGYRYYENMLKKTKEKNLIKLLKFLLEEESKHYEGIENLHTYLTDSHNLFMYDEETFPQGG